MKSLKKELLFVLVLINFSFGAKYKCSTPGYPLCTIEELNVVGEDDRIELEGGDNPGVVTEVSLQGTIRVLSDEIVKGICETFPNLKEITGLKVSLEEIKENAFQSCNELTFLMLDWNKVVKLHRNSFVGANKLEKLFVGGGNVPVIDLDLTQLTELKSLRLAALNVSVTPVDTLRQQSKLEKLWLYSNNLFDLDVEGILKYTPNLKTIYLADNNFKCGRLRQILALLKEKNIEADPYTGYTIDNLRHRTYTPDKIDDIHCLNDELWETELKKNPTSVNVSQKTTVVH